MEDNKQATKMNLLGMTKQPNTIKLYHGSPNKIVHPTYGMGKDTHDYGRGFYLTPDIELAREWSRNRGVDVPGWLHSYELDCTDLSILDFESVKKQKGLYWVSELLEHREPDDDSLTMSANYTVYKKFLRTQFNLHSENYDVVSGWRADDSYFQIALSVVHDNLELSFIEEALRLGNLGIQYCCRSAAAFRALRQIGTPESVPDEYALRYERRDLDGRRDFAALIQTEGNKDILTRFTLRDLVSAFIRNGGKL